MSPENAVCAICGYVLYDYKNLDPWISQFRILYSRHDTLVALTGVGICHDPETNQWTAPLDPARHCSEGQPETVQIGMLRDCPVDGRYGFPFHEACWALMEEAYKPQSIPLEALFRVCSSLPIPRSRGGGIDWGGDLGGLLKAPGARYPLVEIATDRLSNETLAVARRNPHYHRRLRTIPRTAVFANIKEEPVKVFKKPPATDCFSRLPPEIVAYIATFLHTHDALNLRLASSCFVSIYYSQQFWASRFKPYGEVPWLFEARAWDKGFNWRWLWYNMENVVYASPGLPNRTRVWALIRRIQKIVDLRYDDSSPPPASAVDNPDQQPSNNNTKWLVATGDIRDEASIWSPDFGFDKGCRQLSEQQVAIPPGQVLCIAFSLVELGQSTFIAGIRFILGRGRAIQLGYRADCEQIIDDAAVLTGFALAAGEKGIQGIQCIFDNQHESRWIGDLSDAPRTKRLMLSSEPVKVIKGGFDGCKIVSLAIMDPDPHPCRRFLRDAAFWNKEIPPPDLCLNDRHFMCRYTCTAEYQPLSWALFGGRGGIYLRSIVGISVSWQGAVRGIVFHHDDDNDNQVVPRECRELGARTQLYYGTGYVLAVPNTVHFPMDGPGGELIDSVKLCLRCRVGHNLPHLESFKISTTYGRSCHFGPKNERPDVVDRPVVVARGSTITGFYWYQADHLNGITALGVISEAIERE